LKSLRFIFACGIIMLAPGCAGSLESTVASATQAYLPNSQGKKLIKRAELKKILPDHKFYNDHETFYLFSNGKMLYEDRDDGSEKRGLWFLKQATFNYDSPSPYHDYEPNNKELKGETVVCLAVGASVVEEFSWSACLRIYKENAEKENLVLIHRTMCNIKSPVKNGVIHCNWARRTFAYYRIKSKDEK